MTDIINTTPNVLSSSYKSHTNRTVIEVADEIPKGFEINICLKPTIEHIKYSNTPYTIGTHGCCATQSITGFYCDVKNLDLFLAKTLSDHYDHSVVLTDTQAKIYGATLIKHEFEKIRRWHNRVHGPSILNLYLRGFQDDEPLPLEK